MKQFLSILGISLLVLSCGEDSNNDKSSGIIQNPVSASGKIDSSKSPAFNFDEDVYTFGEIRQGEIVQHDFEFTNTGGMPLVISEARASCGCTVPEWPKKAIMPGDKANIRVKFDSDGKEGSFRKTVTIFANTYPSQNVLIITGNIIK